MAVNGLKNASSLRARFMVLRGLSLEEVLTFLAIYSELPPTIITTLASQFQNNYTPNRNLLLPAFRNELGELTPVYSIAELKKLGDPWAFLEETAVSYYQTRDGGIPTDISSLESLHLVTLFAIMNVGIFMEHHDKPPRATEILDRMADFGFIIRRGDIQLDGEKISFKMRLEVVPSEEDVLVNVVDAPMDTWKVQNATQEAFKEIVDELVRSILYQNPDKPSEVTLSVTIKPSDELR